MPGMASDPRIHVTGASGTGASTLGRALADALGVAFVDTDDIYWMPPSPRFTTKRSAPDRLRQLVTAQGPGGWIVAGSLSGWGDRAIADADLIVFLTVPTAQRLARLRRRERAEHGERILPGGDMARIHSEFINWAAQYDDPHFSGRSRVMHEAWLIEQTAPVLRLEGTRPVDALVAEVLAALA